MTFSNICRKEVITVNILFYYLTERKHRLQFKDRWTSPPSRLIQRRVLDTVPRTHARTHVPAASANEVTVLCHNTLQHV